MDRERFIWRWEVNDTLAQLHNKMMIQRPTDPMNVQIETIRVKARLLKSIHFYARRCQTEDRHLEVLLARFGIRCDDSFRFLEHLVWHEDPLPFILQKERTIRRLSMVLKKLELFKLEVRNVYSILAEISTRSMVFIPDENAVIPYLYSVLKDTRDLIDSNSNSIVTVKKELKAAEKGLKFLKCFLLFVKERSWSKLLQTHVETAAFAMACLLYLLSAQNKEQDVKIDLEVHMQKIMPFQSETREIYIKALEAVAESRILVFFWKFEIDLEFLDSLVDIMVQPSQRDLSSIRSFRDQISALHELINYYKANPLWSETEQFDVLCTKANFLTIETGYVFFLLGGDTNNNEDMARELKTALSDLMEKFEDAKAHARKMYDTFVSKLLQSNFPRTNFQSLISSLLQNLEDLVKYSEAGRVSSVKRDIEEVREALLCLRDDFSKIPKIPRGEWTRFNDVAHQAECVIDLFIASGPLLNFKFGMFDAIEEIKIIGTELGNVQSKMTNDDTSVQEVDIIPRQVSTEPDSLSNDAFFSSNDYAADGMTNSISELVAFEDGAEKILDHLTSEEKELQIISIVGLPGIGKTTLADTLYDHPSVTSCFRVRARICVSKAYERRKLLLDILQGVIGGIEKIVEKDDEEQIEEVLHKGLKGKRYLIIMDDIWDIRPWLDIKACFEDDKQSSRIIFTSRSLNIASQAKRKSITYQLDLLSDKKSWKMLRSKLFEKEENCPAELVEVGKEIAKGCKGLPLTIDLIAGVLRIKERNQSCWQQVAKNIMTEIADDPQQRCQNVLEQSYSDLPDHLKPCFLYFGAFPENAEVPAKRLIWLWIAEGFVHLQKVDESIENSAEAYLNHLIARSLVTVSKRRSLGGVKSNRVHDLLHDFACRKAEEEFFLLQMKGQVNLSSSSTHEYINEGYRMCLNSQNCIETPYASYRKSMPFGSCVRSILFNLNRMPQKHRSSLSFDFGRFRLLRVLDLQDIERSFDEDYRSSLIFAVHLKFIALSATQDWILDEIPNFQSLETLLLVGRGFRIFTINNIWNLSRLRHFCVGYCILQLPRMKIPEFSDLLTLSTVCLRCDEETERMMRRLPNLQRLSCIIYDSWDYKKKCNFYPKLDFLEQLYSLKMVYVGKVLHPVGEFSFPPYLKKLTLSEFRLPWSEISTIAKLEHLEVLKLRIRAFEGEIWHMRDGEFPSLKVLSLCKLDIRQWNAEDAEDELPPLERLEVFDCRYLEELPFCLANIPTLKEIWLWQCSSSAENSAERIVEEQRANENEELKFNRDPPAKTGWRDRMEFLLIRS